MALSLDVPRRQNIDWALHFRDQAISRKLLEAKLSELQDVAAVTRAIDVHRRTRHVGPTAEEKWLEYEAQRIVHGGRSFPNSRAYKTAVNRAKRGAEHMLAMERTRKQAAGTPTAEN